MIDSGIVVPGERVLECKAGGDTHYAGEHQVFSVYRANLSEEFPAEMFLNPCWIFFELNHWVFGGTDLGEDGEIWYGESRVFDSLSAFNLYVVRQVPVHFHDLSGKMSTSMN